jgi:hypothetical protein
VSAESGVCADNKNDNSAEPARIVFREVGRSGDTERREPPADGERSPGSRPPPVSTGLICLCVVAGQHQRSTDPLWSSKKEEPDSDTGYVYSIHVRTAQPHFLVNDSSRPVQVGMTVQADIITERRRVMDFFLSSVVKYLDEGLKVR